MFIPSLLVALVSPPYEGFGAPVDINIPFLLLGTLPFSQILFQHIGAPVAESFPETIFPLFPAMFPDPPHYWLF